MKAGRPAIPVLIGPFSGPVHGVSVISRKLAETLAASGVAVVRIDLAPPGWRRGFFYHLVRALRALTGVARVLIGKGRPRYVMNVDSGLGLAYNIALALAARVRSRPVALYHHSSRYVWSDSFLLRLLLRTVGREPPQIFCSEKMADLFQARYGPRHPLIISNAAWVEPPPPGCGSEGGLRLGLLSSLSLAKGVGRALETFEELRRRGLAAELALAGPIPDDAVRALIAAARAKWKGAVSWAGALGEADKGAFYGGLDVFLFPSLYADETQSLVVPEALAAGTPVVAYDHRFVAELLGSGGLVVPPEQDFGRAAADFAAQGQDAAVRQARRQAAGAQYVALARQAQGQTARLIDWMLGREGG